RRSSVLESHAIANSINRQLGRLPEGRAFTFMPPAILGIGSSGGFDLMLEDRSSMPLGQLAGHVNRFMAACSKRPELSRLNNAFRPIVPQRFVQVDEDRALKQGVDLGDVYATLGAFMGGAYVNDFNRFGRVWRVYIEAEGKYRQRVDQIGSFYVRNSQNISVPLSTLTNIQDPTGTDFVSRFQLYNAAEITGSAAPGYSSGEAMAALQSAASQTLPPEVSVDWSGMSYQERRAGGVGAVLGLSVLL